MEKVGLWWDTSLMKSPKPSGQVSFRALMDRIPQPALCLNSSGQAWYANEAAARELGVRCHQNVLDALHSQSSLPRKTGGN